MSQLIPRFSFLAGVRCPFLIIAFFKRPTGARPLGFPYVVSLPTLMQTAVSIVSVCSPTLAHIGCNTRVWQVKRTVHEDEDGAKYIIPTLAPQENPEIPEQFLVVRA